MPTAERSLRVLVAGAGIGGLSTAIALGRRGIAVDMVERSATWDVYGVGIILQSNAIRALDSLGISDACVSEGFPYSVSTHCDANGAVFRERPKPNVGDARFPSSCGVLRKTLHCILSDRAVELGARVRLSTWIELVHESTDGVSVVFNDGSRGEFDLVVGADGAGSALRRDIFGPEQKPKFTGQGCWRITAPRPPEIDRAFFYHGERSLAGLVPVTQELMYLLLLTAEPGNPYFELDALRPALAERLAEYGGLIGQLATDLPDGRDIVYRPLEPLLLAAPWATRRVVLIGDAAHSTTPHLAQGASMAFEDAVVLDDLLVAAGFNVPAALANYTGRRFERCRRIVESSVQIGDWQLAKWAGTDVGTVDPIGLSAALLEELRAPI